MSVAAAPTTPIAVAHSSYENKARAALALGSSALPPGVTGQDAIAFGDFFQDGSYGLVSHTLEYNPSNPATASMYGHIHFWKKVGGAWSDQTSSLLSNNVGCLHARKALVADFNGDGKPDVFFVCHGFDAPPYPGEAQHLLLSQPNGTYQNITLSGITCYCHGGTAFDETGKGYADVVVATGSTNGEPALFLVRNNQDGTFTKDTTTLPSTFNGKSVYSVEAIDLDGNGTYDLWLGGFDPGSEASGTAQSNEIAPQLLYLDASMNVTRDVALPTSTTYGMNLDAVVSNGKLYVLRTNINGSTPNVDYYSTAAVQSVDLTTLAASTPYTHSGAFPNGRYWDDWIIPTASGVASLDSSYGIVAN